MVWDTTQSTLYTLSGAVERHNADLEGTPKAKAPAAESGLMPEKDCPPDERGQSLDAPRPPLREPAPVKPENEHGDDTARAALPCGGCPRPCPRCKPVPPKGPLESLLNDKDALLLAGLILLLWHQKADMKLIAALAFILLSN